MSESPEPKSSPPRVRPGGLPRGSQERGAGVSESERVLSALGQLKIAQDELGAAQAELAANRIQLQELVDQYESGRRLRERLFALLPVGVLATDELGRVLEANDAAAAMLGMRPAAPFDQLLRDYVDSAESGLVDDLLAQMTEGVHDPRAVVTLQSSEENATIELIGLRDPTAGPPTSRWLLMARADRLSSGARPAGGDAAVDDLRAATAIAQLWRLPSDLVDPQRLLGQITSVIRSAIRPAATVSITIGNPISPDRLASDYAAAQHLDGLQLQLGEGPCVDAYGESAAVVVADLDIDRRWPRLAAASRGQPLHSVLALPIRLSDSRAGVITVYGRAPGVFAERSVRTGELISAAVAAVLRGAEERTSLQNLIHHLERALSSRATIEQAKGIVMAHFGGTADEAFARLVAYSSTHNTKLRDVAALIVEGGGRSPVGDL